jgi:hypothetical protein
MKFVVYGSAVLAAIIVLAGVYILIARHKFDVRVGDLRDALAASQRAETTAPVILPEIVRTYALRAGGREGAPSVVHLRHQAALTTAKGAPPIALTSDQWVGTVRPGIVWRAEGSMNGLPVTVFDVYVDGAGELSAMLLGVFRVAGGTGPDYDRGELLRYLSELPVHPDAILNNSALMWRQLDAQTVEVTALSPSGPVSLRFIFDEAGDIVRSEADDRPMSTSDGRLVPTPWHGTFANYTQFGAYRIPAYGEVGWVLSDGLYTYWRGTIVSYEPAE